MYEELPIRKRVKRGDYVRVNWAKLRNRGSSYMLDIPDGIYEVLDVLKTCSYRGNCSRCYGLLVLKGDKGKDAHKGRCLFWSGVTPIVEIVNNSKIQLLNAEDFVL
jgi:hypothetical protein